MERSLKLEKNLVSHNWDEFALTRSQDLPKSYHDCGQLYYFMVVNSIKTKKLITDNSLRIIVPETEVQDINTIEDLRMA